MGFELTIAEGKEVGRQFDFDQTSVVIGRTHECDVILYEAGVSRSHARIFLEGADWFLEDLGSSNGTLVNGEGIKRHPLKEGDRITIGPVAFTWRPVDLAPPEAVELGAEDGGAHTRIVSVSELKKSRNRAVASLPRGATKDEMAEMGRRGTMQIKAIVPSAPRPPRVSAPNVPKVKLAERDDELPEGVAVAGGGRPALFRESGERRGLSAAERARFKRQGTKGSLQLWWREASQKVKAAAITGVVAFLAGVTATLVWLVTPEPKPKLVEPTSLATEPVEYSYGLGEGVTFEHADEKSFEFQVKSPVQVMAVLHFQSKDISAKDEVTITVNGNELGSAPPDGLDVDERVNEVIIPASVVSRTDVNTVVFDNTRNPPEKDPWRVWGLWLEVAVLPEKDAAGLAADAQAKFQKGMIKWDQREIGASNRWEAYRYFRDAWLTMEAIEGNKPATYLLAREKMREARVELDLKCRNLLLEARTAYNQKQYDQARFALDHVADFFPSRAHPCPDRAAYERTAYEL
jgi:hypothetical protein